MTVKLMNDEKKRVMDIKIKCLDVSNKKHTNFSSELKIMHNSTTTCKVDFCDSQWRYIIKVRKRRKKKEREKKRKLFYKVVAHMSPIPLHSQTPSPMQSELSLSQKAYCNFRH